MSRFLLGALTAALLFVSSNNFSSSAFAADPDGLPPQNTVTMNFQNVDIPVLAKFISEITGRNFIIDESVRGKVTIISPSKVTPEQAYSIFQSVLQVKGFTTVQAGKVIKIEPARNVRSNAKLTQSQTPAESSGDEYVTRMVRLKNIEAASVIGVIQPMVSHDGLVAAFPGDNTIIVTDDAFNVERLLQIIGALDVRGEQQSIVVIPLRLAFATELAPEIDQLMAAKMGASSGSSPQMMRPQMGVATSTTGPSMGYKVIPDERTNCLVVAAPPLQMREIQEIVAKLDVNPPLSTSRIHVYRLKNAQALEMVQVLNNLLNGGGGPSTLSPTTGKGSLGRSSFNDAASGQGGGFGGMGSSGGMGGMSSSASFGGSMSGGGGMGGTNGSGGFGGGSSGGGISRGGGSNNGPASASSQGKSIDFSYPVNITADPATNAMVISASPQDWQTLKQIIDDLDTPRVQIFVQAVIVEVSAERQRQLGVNFYSNGVGGGSVFGVGALNFGQLQSAISDPLSVTGLGLGLAGNTMCTVSGAALAAATAATGTTTTTTTTGNLKIPCDVALIMALETDTHADVLSAPTLLTADNEEAMIVVGENLPFVGSASANAGLPGQIFNSVERQNVGITLDIVPQVSEGDYVKLDLYEEVSNVVNGTANNTLGPTTTIRSASTSVLIQNHRTAVVGGLLASQDTLDNQGVPFISDIPVIGNFFSNKSTDKQKDNLIVFLTPHIIRNKSQLRDLALDERQQYVNSLGRKEIHDMPASQIRQIYKPSFSIPVSPAADLNAPYGGAAAPPGPENPGAGYESTPSGGNSADTPFNTTEIGPTSMNSTAPSATGGAASISPPYPAPLGRSGNDSTISAPTASAPPYSASAAPYASTGGGTAVTPLDSGAGKVTTDSSSGVTPAIAP
ncbi:MAG: type II secretion system secretin GspD [Candidatus Binatus sp.]|jgi:general secretion pathway protein D|uniref:type II secretion system secretin GspD n=3 Tax=Candidatus Binatus sp. TaxID=2811406 RepID=UPI003C713516